MKGRAIGKQTSTDGYQFVHYLSTKVYTEYL